MTRMDCGLQYRRLRAPGEHGGVLIEPPASSLEGIVENNRQLSQEYDYDCQGRSLADLANEARRGLLDEARRYTQTYRDVESTSCDTPDILMAGHQPELFHAGVWFKNFALATLAERPDTVSVNLLIDNDPVRSIEIKVPTGTADEPHVQPVAMDRAAADFPFEERSVLDLDLFASFGDRVHETVRPLIPQPIITQIWPEAVAAARGGRNLGQSIALARHGWERDHGLMNLELPLSRVCSSQPFSWFLCHLVAHLPRFWELYNASLNEYRRVNRIRSRSHPAPHLVRQDDWLEAPFWIWQANDPKRRRLFVRTSTNQFELSDHAHWRANLPLTADGNAESAVQFLTELSEKGIKLRPRALVTTMYARLLLCDLFLHGIGGAKYDQVTDMLIRRFWGMEPPGLFALSATVTLPVAQPQISIEDLRRVEKLLRELRFHPEQHLDAHEGQTTEEREQAQSLVATKLKWLAMDPPRGQRRERHLEISRANEALQAHVAQKQQLFEQEKDYLLEQLRKNSILGSREHSFSLFPEDFLRPLLLELLGRHA